MRISKKCQYALKAVFELAIRNSDRPLKIQQVASAQRIPVRFLEVILNELKHGGYVESRRGNDGGYILARNAEGLTVREVIEYIQGPISVAPEDDRAPFSGSQAFGELWQEVNSAVRQVCDNRTFADLAESERARRNRRVVNYSI